MICKIEILTVYRSSDKKQVAVDCKDLYTGRVVFLDINYFIFILSSIIHEKENFQITKDCKIKAKKGNNLVYKTLLTWNEIFKRYPDANVKLDKVIRSKNNYPLGMILYASVVRCGTNMEMSSDNISISNNDSNSCWVCTRVDNPYQNIIV